MEVGNEAFTSDTKLDKASGFDDVSFEQPERHQDLMNVNIAELIAKLNDDWRRRPPPYSALAWGRGVYGRRRGRHGRRHHKTKPTINADSFHKRSRHPYKDAP